MNALPKILFGLTAAATISLAQPVKANLITNGGFETGNLTGWTSNPGFFAMGTVNGVSPHSGNYQAFTATGAGVLAQSFATTLGQSYTVDFWAATRGGATLSALGGGSVFNHIFAGSNGYTEFTFNFTAISAASLLQFSAAGFLFLDDINVQPAGVGVPDGGTTASLLGCTLLGLAGLRRSLSC